MTRQQFLLSLTVLASSPTLLAVVDEIDIDVLTGKKTPPLRYGLQAEASKAFEKMKKEAKTKGIQLHITSGHRDYEKQALIWNGKYERYSAKGLKGLELIKKITEFSAMPGTSRHHWGTDADILDLSVPQPKDPLKPSHYVSSKGVYNKIHDWMLHNSERFGFYEAYTDDPTRTGYEFEPWHFSYKPIAIKYLKAYNKNITWANIKSNTLKGHHLITDDFFQRYKKEYVNGVNGYLQGN